MPDLYNYYTACHLTRIADWNIHSFKKAWVSLEKDFSSRPLHLLPWLPQKSWPHSLLTHPLNHPSLLAISKAIRGGILASILGPLTTLRGNPDFRPGETDNFLPFEDVLAQQFYSDGKPIPLDKLRTTTKMALFPFWTYRQIRHFLETQAHQTCWTRPLTTFESLCHRRSPQRHLISLIYTRLSENLAQTLVTSQESWNRDLQTHLTTDDWNTIHDYAHKGSLNVAIQENGYYW